MSNIFSRNVFGGLGLGFGGAGSRTAYALDTNFTLGSAGKCLGIRFVAPTTTTLTDVLLFLSAAPAGAHDLSINACAQTSATQAGAALTNGTVAVSGGTTAAKWIKATFSTPPDVVQGTAYWIVIGDPSGAASNYSVLSQGGAAGVLQSLYGATSIPLLRSFTSSDGFATAGTGANSPAVVVLVFSDGGYLGQPYSLAVTADSSAAIERGWLITPDEDITISWIVGNPPASSSLKVYPAASAPGGTIYSGFNGGNAFSIPASGLTNTCIRFPPCTLAGGSQYRVVFDPSGAVTFPGYTQIEDDTTHSAILEACGFPGVAMQHTEESGGAWVDTPSKMPRLFLGIEQLPAQAAGGGTILSRVRSGY